MRWWLPDAGSTFAGPIDNLFLAILIITGITFVIVEVGLITFVIRYRGRPGRKAYYTHGSTRAEVIWTAIPAVTMVALGLISNHYWVLIKNKKSIPPNAYHLGVHAKQFEWQITYPGLRRRHSLVLRARVAAEAGRGAGHAHHGVVSADENGRVRDRLRRAVRDGALQDAGARVRSYAR